MNFMRSLAPAPTQHKPFPWRFSLDETAYVIGHPLDASFTVVGGELWLSFPHLHLKDAQGKRWRVPQIHCSSKPINTRKK